MFSPTLTKIIVFCALFVLTFTFSLFPVKFISVFNEEHEPHRRRTYKKAISLLSCYAAGVFLATCLLDLFPDVSENLKEALSDSNINSTYPLAEFILGYGLFLILFVEQLVHMCKDPGPQPLVGYESFEESTLSRQSSYQSYSESSAHESVITQNAEAAEQQEEDEVCRAHEDPSSHSKARSLILLIALSLHSLFEGLAVGLQKTSQEVLNIFAALVLHKCILAFSLGVNLVQSKLSLGAIIKSNLLFSVTSPIGIAIGILIVKLGPGQTSANFINGILAGLACGTFLYVVFIEIIPHEFMRKRRYPNKMLKVLCLVLGYSTVALVLFLEPGN